MLVIELPLASSFLGYSMFFDFDSRCITDAHTVQWENADGKDPISN